MTTISSYLMVARDLDRWRAVAAKQPDVASETRYFRQAIGKATTIDALLKDRRLFNYAMRAFGLADKTFAVGLMRKALEQGADDPKALANTLRDSNIRAFVKAFDFSGKGAAAVSPSLVEDVVGRYVERAMQAEQGARNPGVELALYFRERAPQLTSVYGVLADKKLLEVVQTALGIARETSAQPIDTQARLLRARLDVADFKDPKKLSAFIARFSAAYDMKNAESASADNAVLLGASFGGGGVIGVDVGLILRMQNMRRG